MSELKNIIKLWLNSLSILDNNYFNASIIIILVLYSSVIFENINIYVSELYNYSVIRLIILLLIIYIAPKDPTISILLGISYIISIYYMNNDINNTNNTNSSSTLNDNKKITSMEKDLYKLNNKIENFQLSNNNSTIGDQIKNLVQSTKPDDIKSVINQIKDIPAVKNIANSILSNTNTPQIKESFENKLPFLINNENGTDNGVESSNTCKKIQIPTHEQISNSCEPVKLFNAEYNAQGLNNEIMGQNINYNPMGANI